MLVNRCLFFFLSPFFRKVLYKQAFLLLSLGINNNQTLYKQFTSECWTTTVFAARSIFSNSFLKNLKHILGYLIYLSDSLSLKQKKGNSSQVLNIYSPCEHLINKTPNHETDDRDKTKISRHDTQCTKIPV